MLINSVECRHGSVNLPGICQLMSMKLVPHCCNSHYLKSFMKEYCPFQAAAFLQKYVFWNFYGSILMKQRYVSKWKYELRAPLEIVFSLVAIVAYKIAYKTYSNYLWLQNLISDVSNFVMFGENSPHFWKNFGLKFDVHAQCSGVEKNTFWNYFLQALKPL